MSNSPACGAQSAIKSHGQLAYEADVLERPTYPSGTPRKAWDELNSLMQWSWERADFFAQFSSDSRVKP